MSQRLLPLSLQFAARDALPNTFSKRSGHVRRIGRIRRQRLEGDFVRNGISVDERRREAAFALLVEKAPFSPSLK